MGKSHEYVDMKKMLNHMRDEKRINEVVGDNMGDLENNVMDSDNKDMTITLDDNKTAKIIMDNNTDIPQNILGGLETVLNGFITAIQGTVSNIELITVHLGDASMVITVKVNLQDGQPATIHVDSESQHIQMKYDNFFVLDDPNVRFMTQAKNYFNPRLMSQLQGVTKTI